MILKGDENLNWNIFFSFKVFHPQSFKLLSQAKKFMSFLSKECFQLFNTVESLQVKRLRLVELLTLQAIFIFSSEQ
jgi:hypothetical protein